jgi:glucuronokinase
VRIVRDHAPARAALAGNPSDGYGGKTISFTIPAFRAEATIYEWPELEIVPAAQDQVQFDGIEALVEDVRLNGYYGGLRLVKAAIKCFRDHCLETGQRLPETNFSIRYGTTVPRGVGLGGSSAIVTAVILGLCDFFEVRIPQPLLPNLILRAETEELGIPAGLQDRVAQVYGGVTYMDFDPQYFKQAGHGRYESLDPDLLPPLWLAYRPDAAGPSDAVHAAVRHRHQKGDDQVASTMEQIAALAERARDALLAGDAAGLGRLMDRNLELRRRIFELDPRHLRMVELAREHGCHANYAGSGGAVVILPSWPEDPWSRLSAALEAEGCILLDLRVATESEPGSSRAESG